MPRYTTTGNSKPSGSKSLSDQNARLETEAGPVFHWSMRAMFIGFTAAVCAYSAGWLS